MNPRSLRRKLARDFPLSRRVVVTFEECQEPDTLGEAWIDGETMRINLSPKVSDAESCHDLLHEWAHLLDWDETGRQTGRHSIRWAKIYAKLYNRYVPE